MADHPQVPGLSIERELGRGAHSVVYRASLRGVACAAKFPRVRARWTRWIYREAVSLARVRHPLLPAVLEVGEVDGLPYLIMELIEGTSLAETLSTGPADEALVIGVGQQLASVLAAVHEAGLVHRDVKPRNIVVDASTGAIKLVDFGFATPMERLAGPEPAGTEAYAAPEQLAPPGNVDARTDLYAVGRVLFEALTGQSLSSRVQGPWGQEARAELVNAGVSPGLADVVSHLLRRAPRDRYPSGHALAGELSRITEGRAPLGPAAYTFKKPAPELVARSAELDRIVSSCRTFRAGGAVVVVRGIRGSGKSQLLTSVEAESRSFARTVRVSCQKDDPPLSTLRRILDGYADENVGALVRHEDFRDVIGNLAPVVQLIAPPNLLAALHDTSTAAIARGPQEIGLAADSLVEGAAEILLRFAARVSPTVVLVDDAHWMDPASADALLRVAHRVAEAPLALVLAARPGLPGDTLERFSKVRAARNANVTIPLLTDRDVEALVVHHLGSTDVDPEISTRIHSMADGTPLGVLEVLGAFLDAGVVRPHAGAWRFDVLQSETVVLPAGALALLGRRLAELPAATRRVLEMAAIIGTRFDEVTLASTVDIALEDLGYALASARRAGLIAVDSEGAHRFIHDSLRERLVDELDPAERRRLHQRVAKVLSTRSSPSFEDLCAAALHFAAGEPDKLPDRVASIARAAGEAALLRFDNETALRFLTQARTTAESARIRLDSAFFQAVGEAQLRLGALDESVKAFEAALERATDVATRAKVLGRLSWTYQTRAEPDRAWELLGRAFEAVGHRMPVEDAASAATTSMHLARFRLGRFLSRPSSTPQVHIDLLSALHYQNARLGLEYGKPARLIQSSLESLELSERGGSAEARARARAFYALVVTVLRRGDAGSREIAKAKAIAQQHGDAATLAFCVQLQFVAASWAGDLDLALNLLRECIDVHGPWLELNEYFQDVSTGDLLQSVRGRSSDAWAWIDRAIERLRRTRARPVIAEFLIHRARAALAAIGGSVKDDPWLAEQLLSVSARDAGNGFHRLMSWGPRARYYLEADDLGADFETLVDAFEAEKHNPRSVHLGVAEYYLAVAAARLQQTLRASAGDRSRKLSLLREATADLYACAKIPLFKGHALAIDGYIAWFDGNERKAMKLFAEAEAVADQQSCPWVLYSVARGRAHMLRASGKEQAARDQANVALLFAREHGAATRARWIREEFGLTERISDATRSTMSSRGSSSSRTTRHLAALLQVARASRRDLRTEQQAGAVLDELMSSIQASRGAIWFQPEPHTSATAVFRQRGKEGSLSVGADSPHGALLRAVHQAGVPWPPLDGESRILSGEHAFDVRRMLAVPLSLYERTVGALCIERGAADPAFTNDDRTLLTLLSNQVPVTLEMARLLFEREQLHSSLQQAKKMEAMGQLAGGLAHDFNNMLGAMKVALSAARELAHDTELAVELDIISEATTRAAQLTSQLLSFSRHQPVPVAVHDVNHLISTLEPMLRRVVGSKVTISSTLSPAIDSVEVDQGSFDQALVNLLINARDAMPNGGTLTIKTRNVVLADSAAQHLNLPPGTYAEVEITDTGEGMSADTLSRVFEPFFTTKPAGSGSGLGLAMVYAFARNCGGSIDVSSELGQGTQFRLYLRTVPRARASTPPRNLLPAPSPVPTVIEHGGPDTILVVDDDDLVRRSIAKTLERNGYRVLAAGGSGEALDVAREEGARIGLVILDVLMPGVTGPELGRRLTDLNLSAKLLFVSGFAPESIPFEDAQVAADLLLQKPFSQATLLERVRQLMHH